MAGAVAWPVVAIAFLLHAALVSAADRFVKRTGIDTGTCTSSAAPCATLGYAIGQAGSGDEVKVGVGSYEERLAIVTPVLGISGGWNDDFTVQDPTANTTRLRGPAGNQPILFDDIFVIDTPGSEAIDLTLDGLTLSRARRGIWVEAPVNAVVSIALSRCAVTQMREWGIFVRANGTSTFVLAVDDSVFARNLPAAGASYLIEGPAAFVVTEGSSSANVSFVDTRFERNRSRGRGGAIWMAAGDTSAFDLAITRCAFFRNRAPRATGGAVFAGGADTAQFDVQIAESTFDRNRAEGAGALDQFGGALAMANTALLGNVGRDFGGGAVLTDATSTVANSTFARNKGGTMGGVWVIRGSAAFTNTILWDNSGDDLLPNDGAVVTADHCDVQEGIFTDLGGNISIDPVLVGKNDAHLASGSPCRDAGTCSGVPASDIDGDPRPTGAGCDIGADEIAP